jgi:type I restriction enzyme S subunit
MVADVTRDGKYVTPQIDSLTREGAGLSRPMKKGDLVIAVSGDPGLPAILATDACIHDGFVGLRNLDTSQVSVDFLYRFLLREKERTNRQAVGAIFKNLTSDQIRGIDIPLPSLAEQGRIAAILDQAEVLRAKRRHTLTRLDTLTQSLFLDLFGDLVTNPKRFSVVEMGDVCDVRDGTHDSPKYVTEGYPLVTSKNLASGTVDLTEINLISKADYDAINKRSKVDRGDLLMPMIGTIGNPVLVDHEPNYAVKNVALIKFPEGAPLNIFIRTVLSSHYFDHVVFKKNRGGTQKFVSLGDLRSFPVPLPSPELQREFAAEVSAVERLKASQRASLAKLDALFGSLQHRAFRGEL